MQVLGYMLSRGKGRNRSLHTGGARLRTWGTVAKHRLLSSRSRRRHFCYLTMETRQKYKAKSKRVKQWETVSHEFDPLWSLKTGIPFTPRDKGSASAVILTVSFLPFHQGSSPIFSALADGLNSVQKAGCLFFQVLIEAFTFLSLFNQVLICLV